MAVIAFYSAVHYVNAYLWERYRFTPSSHGERSGGVRNDRAIRACRPNYGRLRDAGYYARYDERFALSEQDARELVETDLRRVEATVLLALGESVPTW